jgi:hypothetical protein
MPYGIHFVPLGILISTLEIYLLGMHAFGYGIASFIFHFINVFIVFYSIFRLTKHRTIALLGAAFFGVNYSIREGVFWYASDPMVELCTSFVLIGIIQFITFYMKRKVRNFYISFFFFISAILLYEYMFMLFFVNMFFLISLFLGERKRKYLFFAGMYLVVIFVYSFIRLFYVHATSAMIVSTYDVHLIIITIWGAITLTPKLITAIILPQEWILFISNFLSQNIYSNLAIAQSSEFKSVLYYDQIDIFFGFMMLFAMIFMFVLTKKIRKEQRYAILLYGISFYLYPLVFLTLSAYLYWVYSRYLYLQAALYIICLFSIIALMPLFKKKTIFSWIVFTLSVIFICSHAYLNHMFFVSYDSMSKYRLSVVKRVYKKLNFSHQQEVLYIKSTSGGYSNDSDIFDIGTSFGKEMLIWSWFQDDNRKELPSCLYDPLFLFSSPVNGYEQCDEMGYGYFQNIDMLAKAVTKYKINKDNIVALNYNSKLDTLTDISKEIRSRL